MFRKEAITAFAVVVEWDQEGEVAHLTMNEQEARRKAATEAFNRLQTFGHEGARLDTAIKTLETAYEVYVSVVPLTSS